jgi:hypothetical protein
VQSFWGAEFWGVHLPSQISARRVVHDAYTQKNGQEFHLRTVGALDRRGSEIGRSRTQGSRRPEDIDQWCTVFCLKPLDIWIAGGERGACPHDVLNDVPSWVMRSVQAKKVSEESLRHMQGILCFGILLQQRFSFDWFRLCFLSAINPMQKIRVLRREGPDLKPPPIVVQMDVEHYIVIIENPMVCIRLQGKNSGYRAVNAWCSSFFLGCAAGRRDEL